MIPHFCLVHLLSPSSLSSYHALLFLGIGLIPNPGKLTQMSWFLWSNCGFIPYITHCLVFTEILCHRICGWWFSLEPVHPSVPLIGVTPRCDAVIRGCWWISEVMRRYQMSGCMSYISIVAPHCCYNLHYRHYTSPHHQSVSSIMSMAPDVITIWQLSEWWCFKYCDLFEQECTNSIKGNISSKQFELKYVFNLANFILVSYRCLSCHM